MITITPQARAIAAFSLAVLMVTGNLNRVALVVYSVSGNQVSSDRTSRVILALLIVVVAVGVLWLARTAAALTSTTPGGSWDHHLAIAAWFLGLAGLAVAVVMVIGAISNQGPFIYVDLPVS